MSTTEDFKILIADDDKDITDMLEYNLSKERFRTKTTNSGSECIKIAEKFLPDLILLDIMMPKLDGIEICRRIKEIPKLSNCFIVFLTARLEEYSEVAAFEVGADDYIIKPIKPRALISRIHAILRRDHKKIEEHLVIQLKDLKIDKGSYQVKQNGELIEFTKKEFELLFFLAQNQGKVLTRERILHQIWGSDVYVWIRTIDVHIRKIREKIGDSYISTIKGVGYKFE